MLPSVLAHKATGVHLLATHVAYHRNRVIMIRKHPRSRQEKRGNVPVGCARRTRHTQLRAADKAHFLPCRANLSRAAGVWLGFRLNHWRQFSSNAVLVEPLIGSVSASQRDLPSGCFRIVGCSQACGVLEEHLSEVTEPLALTLSGCHLNQNEVLGDTNDSRVTT